MTRKIGTPRQVKKSKQNPKPSKIKLSHPTQEELDYLEKEYESNHDEIENELYYNDIYNREDRKKKPTKSKSKRKTKGCGCK
jgi:hypothetical protein